MPNAGIMASWVNIASCTNVLQEPFDNLTNWTTEAGSPTIVAGRTGTAVKLPSSGVPARIRYTIPSANESDTITIGFAFKISGFGGAEEQFLQLWSDSQTVQHTVINITTTGTLKFMRAATVLATSTATITTNTWQYLEVQAKLHDTAGFGIVKLNGTEIINVTGVDTRNAGTKATYDTLYLPPLFYDLYVDDLYISTGSGCPFQGDHTIPGCTSVLQEPFDNLTNWANAGATIVAGRNGTAIQLTGGNTAEYSMPAPSYSFYATIGFAYQVSSVGTVARPIFSFRTSASNDFATLQVNIDGSLGLIGGTTTPTYGTSAAGLIVANTWYYLEVQMFIDDTAGYFTVRRNGTIVASGSGMDTEVLASPASGVARIILRNVSGQTSMFDDLYLSTGSGCAFQGDHVVPSPTAGLLLQDPCENFSAWTNTGGTIVAAKNANGFQFSAGSANKIIYALSAGAQTDTLTVGFWFKPGGFFTGWNLVRFQSDAGATSHAFVTVDAAGFINLTFPNGSASTAGTTLTAGTWYYIEAQIKLHDTAGTATLKVGGTTVAAVTGVDTKNAGTKTVFDQLWINSVGSLPSPFQVDDIYIRNDATFMGPHP